MVHLSAQSTDFGDKIVASKDSLPYWDSLSTNYIFSGSYDSSKIILLKGLPIIKSSQDWDLLVFFLFKLGYIKEQLGKDPASEYLEAVRIAEKYNVKKHLAMLYQKVAYVEKNRGRLPLAVENAEKAIKLAIELNGRPDAAQLVNLSWFRHENKEPLKDCLESLNRGESLFANEPGSLQLIYHGFSELYLFKREDYSKALIYLDKALAVKSDRYRTKSLANKAMALDELGRSLEALEYQQLAMESYFPDYEREDILSIPRLNPNLTFKQHWYPQKLGKYLLRMGLETEDVESLQSALVAIDRSVEMLDFYRLSLNRTEKNTFAKYQRKNVELGIEICYQLWLHSKDQHYLDRILGFMDHGRSMVLLEKETWLEISTNTQEFRQIDSLSREIQSISINPEIESTKVSDSLVAEMTDDLIRLKNELRKDNTGLFESQFPDFISLEEVLDQISSTNHAVISYFTTAHHVYTLGISKDTVFVIQNKNIGIDSIASKLHSLLKTKSSKYQSLTGVLYDELIAPIYPQLPQKHWTIVQDYSFDFIPIEILQTSSVGAGREILLREKIIKKAPSITLFFKSNKRTFKQEMLAMAPSFQENFSDNNQRGDDVGLVQLQGANDEIEELKSIYSGRFLSGKEATKSFFLDNAHKYKYLHLATHAIINEDRPDATSLAFYSAEAIGNEDGFLRQHELYGLQLSSELVTLSACNTGIGKVYLGEGISSLAKAIVHAGSNNVLMSLWPVDDAVTSDLMISFYDNLSRGYQVSEALSKAKIDFINSHPGDLKHPFYWSGFVLLGKQSEVVTSSGLYFIKSNAVWIGAGLFLFVVIIFSIKNIFFKN
ncbi:hypothetical protein GCM10025777_23170 [Membranihabitans marinus]